MQQSADQRPRHPRQSILPDTEWVQRAVFEAQDVDMCGFGQSKVASDVGHGSAADSLDDLLDRYCEGLRTGGSESAVVGSADIGQFDVVAGRGQGLAERS